MNTKETKELMPPIFIGGTGRSGTTILIRLISQHPEIFTIKWESQFLVANHGLLDLIQTSDMEDINSFTYARIANIVRLMYQYPELDTINWKSQFLFEDNDILDSCSKSSIIDEKYKKFKYMMESHWYERISNKGKPNEYKAGLCEDVSRQHLDCFYELLESHIANDVKLNDPKFIRKLLDILFLPAVKNAGALRWCEKTPSNILAMHELYRIYPNMKFINIIRDGRDVISSIVTRKFWPVAANKKFPETFDFRGEQKPELVARYWSTILEIGDRLAADLPKENYFELRLEDLVNRQDETVKALFEFLGHNPTQEILNFALNKSNEGRWQDDLNEEDLEKINPIITPMMIKKGYYE